MGAANVPGGNIDKYSTAHQLLAEYDFCVYSVCKPRPGAYYVWREIVYRCGRGDNRQIPLGWLCAATGQSDKTVMESIAFLEGEHEANRDNRIIRVSRRLKSASWFFVSNPQLSSSVLSVGNSPYYSNEKGLLGRGAPQLASHFSPAQVIEITLPESHTSDSQQANGHVNFESFCDGNPERPARSVAVRAPLCG